MTRLFEPAAGHEILQTNTFTYGSVVKSTLSTRVDGVGVGVGAGLETTTSIPSACCVATRSATGHCGLFVVGALVSQMPLVSGATVTNGSGVAVPTGDGVGGPPYCAPQMFDGYGSVAVRVSSGPVTS